MKAAVLRGVREQEIEDIDIDDPKSKEVLIRVAAAGVCHSDLHFYNGTWHGGFPMYLVMSQRVSWRKWVRTLTTSSLVIM